VSVCVKTVGTATAAASHMDVPAASQRPDGTGALKVPQGPLSVDGAGAPGSPVLYSWSLFRILPQPHCQGRCLG
ncbi:hypothetical protein NHX12_016216, partial [Muraenolepis orangiensis]